VSNYWRYACLSHDPPIVMDEFGGVGGAPNHAREQMIAAVAVVRRGEWPMTAEDTFGYAAPEPLVGETGCESAAPIEFLLRHPHCRIAVVSEYGPTWLVNDRGEAQQVTGNDERLHETRVRDSRGKATGEKRRGEFPPEGEAHCTCVQIVPIVPLSPTFVRSGMWVRCATCNGLAIAP